MTRPGEQKPSGAMSPQQGSSGRGDRWEAARPRSLAAAMVWAAGVAVIAALGWALLRGILDLGIGLLALAGIGGWAIGALLRPVGGAPLLAAGIGATAWLLGLVLTWLVSMAILQGSTRTFLERIEATPFVDWMSPQFGLLEIAGLLLYAGAAAYAARRGGTTTD